jgi:hypothetical protein
MVSFRHNLWRSQFHIRFIQARLHSPVFAQSIVCVHLGCPNAKYFECMVDLLAVKVVLRF